MGSIFLVDANPTTRAELAAAIDSGGITVLAFESWRAARDEMAGQSPLAVILTDWRRTGGRGAYRRLRHAAGGAPFVMVCDGGVTEWDERFAVVVHYPVAPEALLDALRQVVATAAMVVRLKEFRLDQRRRLLHRGDDAVVLTAIQTGLLAALMRAQGEVLSTAELVEAGWPGQGTEDRRVLYTHIAWLRQRLRSFAPAAVIQNVRGEGYRFVVQAPTAPPDDQAGG